MSLILKLFAALGLLVLIPYVTYSQEQLILAKYECPGTSSSEYLHSQTAKKSDGVCDEGTELRYHLSGDASIVESIELQRLGGGPHTAKVKVNWHSGQTGTVLIDVEFRYRYHAGAFNCKWRDWTYMYTYRIIKESINPGGTLTGESELSSSGEESLNITLDYEKDQDSPSLAKNIKFWVNEFYKGQKSISASQNIISLSHSTSEVGKYNFTTEVQNQCGEWLPGPSKTVSINPSCIDDDPNEALLRLTGNEIIPYDEGFGLTKGGQYTINPAGITDFASHYEFKQDGGEDITLSGNTFTVNADLGSYRIEAVQKEGREACTVIEPLILFVGGHNVTLEQTCLITLPGDLIDFGYDLEPGEPALQHFAATAKSKKGFIIKPGITLTKGCELILDYEEPQIDNSELDPDLNFVQSTTYDEYGRVTGQARQYFDEQGKATQTQYKNLNEDVLMASQTMYDAYGRPVISTLSAPVAAGTYDEEIDECGEQVQSGSLVRFAFKDDFVTGPGNQPYDHTNFDLDKEENPDPVNNSAEGTLGWYYGPNNGNSTQGINEPLVATTAFPYSRVLYHRDGSGEAKSSTIPGDAFRAGGGHLGTADRKAVAEEDTYLENYLTIRKDELLLARPLVKEGNFFKNVMIDAEGMKSVSYQEIGGKTIISLYFGKEPTPITRSYQLYNYRGQLIVSLSPNGWEQYNKGTSFDHVDKTSYFYNVKGQLTAMEEPDAGTTAYVYRRDGSIRFSQNAEQKDEDGPYGRYSYTRYNNSGRPVESGEYIPNHGNGIAFNSPEMKAILEDLTADGGLPEGSGEKRDRVSTFYDEANPDLPSEREQRFVHASVSYTKKESSTTTWYSYDEQSRVEWLVQEIPGLGVKTIDYRYGPTGAVQEVAYQKGVSEEDFHHYFEYNIDGSLNKVFTATEPLQYNEFGEVTNPQVLQQQAAYDYYLHGSLKRIELADQLQGIDFVYTASGALKGINHADKALDPGNDGEGNGFREDVFGMTLDYYNNDYRGAEYNAGSLANLDGFDEQFTGNIRAQSWHSPVDGGKPRTYAYGYDSRFQLAEAVWGDYKGAAGAYSFIPAPLQAFNEAVPGYDPNGNIQQLERKDESGIAIADFQYKFEPNTNKLTEVNNNQAPFLQYDYNRIGQMTVQSQDNEATHLQYDVTGKVLGAYKQFDEASKTYSEPLVTYAYDDRGFRLSKTSYNEEGTEEGKTWYVRDASGSVLSIYSQEVDATFAAQTEVPIYGSGRLGLYRPNTFLSKYTYELNDHLGNVRAVIGEGITIEYLATMESEPEVQQNEAYFENIQSVPTAGYINHTPATVTVDGQEHNIENPNEVARINNARDSLQKVVAGSIKLPVYPGDMINAEVFVKYANFEKNNTNILPGLVGYLTTSFGLPAPVDGVATIFDSYVNELGALTAMGDIKEDVPRAFLNYIIFDKDFTTLKNGFVQVTEAAKIPQVNHLGHPHERLFFAGPIEIKEEGFIYIFVSNDDGQDMDVYFDDFRITHKFGDIVAGSDFYPYGLTMEGREITRDDYRYGYQGQFSEKDGETGWNSFEARMYDPVIGRWNATDPYWQYHSPYMAMGNNPVIYVDKDGRIVWNAIGAAVGGTIGAGFSIYDQMVNEGRSFSQLDGGRVALAAGSGALAGSGLGGLAGAAGFLAAGEAGDQLLASGQITSVDNIVLAGAGGALGGKASTLVHNGLSKVGLVGAMNKIVASRSSSKLVTESSGKVFMSSASTRNITRANQALRESISSVVGGKATMTFKNDFNFNFFDHFFFNTPNVNQGQSKPGEPQIIVGPLINLGVVED